MRFLFKDSVLYGGAAAIGKGFGLITFPLLARHFSVAEYGILDYCQVLAGFLTIIVIFGQDSAVARFYYDRDDIVQRRQLISQSLAFQLLGLLLIWPILWFGATFLTMLPVETPRSVLLFRIVLLQLPFLLLINFSQNLLKWTFARKGFLFMSLGFTGLQTALLVAAIWHFAVSVEEVLIISLSISAVFGVVGLVLVRHWLAWPTDFRWLREMLAFAAPYGVLCVVTAFSPALERSLTSVLLGPEEMGLYAAASKIAMLISLAVAAFQTAWGPFSLSLYQQANAGLTFNWVLKALSLGMCLAALLLTALAQPLLHFLASERYQGAAVAVFPLVMSLAIQAISWVTEIGIGLSKRSYLNLHGCSAALAVTLLGIWWLAPVFGLFGVGLGVMAGQLARAVISSWLAQRAYPLPWEYMPAGMMLAVTGVLGLSATLAGWYWGSLAERLVLGAGIIVVSVLGWRILLSAVERQQAAAFVRAQFQRLKLPT